MRHPEAFPIGRYEKKRGGGGEEMVGIELV